MQRRSSGLLVSGLVATVLLVAGCAAPGGSAVTSAAAQPATSSSQFSRTPTPTSSSSPPGASVGVAATASPTDLGVAVCYFSADLNKPDNSSGVAFGFKDGEDNLVEAQNLVSACHDSLVRMGKIKQADSVAGCVLQNGQIGVIPGAEDVYAALDLPVAALSASAPLPDPNR